MAKTTVAYSDEPDPAGRYPAMKAEGPSGSAPAYGGYTERDTTVDDFYGGYDDPRSQSMGGQNAFPAPRKRGYVNSGDDLDAYYAAWAQSQSRHTDEAQARFRRKLD